MRDNGRYKERFFTLLGLAALVLFYVAIATFSDFDIELDIYDGRVTAVTSRWWGLSKKCTKIRWMQPPGHEFPAWCAESSRGEWYPYLVEPQDVPDLPEKPF